MSVELSGENNFDNSRARILFLLFIYIFINTLFIWKYASSYFSSQIIAPILYIIISIIVLWIILFPKITIKLFPANYRFLYLGFMIIAAILLTILMFQFKPTDIHVGRYSALDDWITKLFAGDFPYDSSARPSGFPFLFVPAIPFYLLGDTGLLQIFSFLILAAIFYFRFRGDDAISLRLMILLIISPIFIFEIVVRSDLFSNMVIVLLYLIVCEKYLLKESSLVRIGLGLLGGLLLSTRSIVLIIFILYFVWKIRKSKLNPYLSVLSILFGFLITLIPFALWNYDYFVNYGPFAVQMSYVPVWFIILSIIISFIWAVKIKTIGQVYFAAATMLFMVVLGAFVIFAVRFGLIDSVMNSQFDISYFCFPLPFVLMSPGATAEGDYTDNRLA